MALTVPVPSTIFQPTSDRLVIMPIDKEETTPSGLVLPQNSKEKPVRGRVIAAGPGKLTDTGARLPMEAKVGDTVVYGRFGGVEVRESIGGETLVIVRDPEILAILKE